MKGLLYPPAPGVDNWLWPAIVSFVACGCIFNAAPAVVTHLLRSYASLTYRNVKDRKSSGCRYFSFTHALVVSSLNFYIIFGTEVFDDSPRSKDPALLIWRVSRLSQISLGISLGYFLIDALLVAWYLPAMGGWDMVTHHISAFISVLVSVWYGEAHMYTLSLLSTECTTPFINFRWLLEKMGWKSTVWYKVNGVCLVMSWIIARILMFFFFFHHLFVRRHQILDMHWPVGVPLLVVPPLLAVLNLLWFSKIARGAVKLFLGSKSQRGTAGTKQE